jgi:hypothetical protein
MINIAGEAVEPVVYFSSHGPVISRVSGDGGGGVVTVAQADISDDKVTLTFTLSDRDSDLSNVTLKAEASVPKFVTAVKLLDPADGVHSMQLTIDPDFDGATATTITITATDEHKNVRTRTFKFETLGPYSAFWATLVKDDAVWCACFDRNLDSRMPLSFTPLLRLKRACV